MESERDLFIQETQGNTNDGLAGFIRQSTHPIAAFFHIAFKVASIFLYIFGAYFTSNFVLIFVLCVLFMAFDFWTVKNVTGRLLVGLRWWNHVKEDGSNEWVFEHLQDESAIGKVDSKIFWTGLYSTPIAWSFLLAIALLKLNFEWIPIVVVALSLSLSNLFGYRKCDQDSKKNTQEKTILQQGAETLMKNSSIRSTVFQNIV